jgi:excisionase family DNA binding protein
VRMSCDSSAESLSRYLPGPWVSVDDVPAKCLGVVKDFIYCWTERQDLPAQKVARFRRFKFTDVDDWGGALDKSASRTGQ